MKRTGVKSITKLIFLLAFQALCLCSMPLRAGIIVETDSSRVEVRMPSNESIQSYKNDRNFHYKRSETGVNLWERFMRWLRRLLSIREGSFADKFNRKYLWYILFAAVLIFVIVSIFRAEIKGLFGKSAKRKIQMEALEEDIHTIDFDNQIQEAVRQKNFRYAIRLYYLKSLKTLSDNGLIEWKPDKTGRDYQYELNGKKVQEAFSSITNLFNWIWYGDLPINEDNYHLAKDEFVEFNRQLSR